jgi:hypothetical protein
MVNGIFSLSSVPVRCQGQNAPICSYFDSLQNVYRRHALLEWIVEGAYPFFFFLTVVSHFTDGLRPYQLVFAVLCVFSYLLAYRVPLSLTPNSTDTIVSRCQENLFAALAIAIEMVARFLLIDTFVSILGHLLQSSDKNKGKENTNVTLSMASMLIFAFTYASFSIICQKKQQR